MADDEPPSDEAKLAAERRRKRPAQTIELTATEVASEPASQTSASTMSSAPEQPERKTERPAGAAPPRAIAAELPFGLSWPVLGAVGAGAVAAVILVLGVLALAGAFGGRSDDPALAARLSIIETQLKTIAERRPATTVDPRTIDDFAARLAKAEQAAASPRTAADPTLAARLDAAETATKVLMDSVASLNRRSDDAATVLRELRERVDAAAKAPTAGADHAQVEQLAGRIAALERAGKTIENELRSENATSDRAVRLAVSTSALKSAAERGTPFAAELAAVRPLVDAKAIEPLGAFASSGVPGAAPLAQELSALVPALLHAATPPQPQEGGLLDRLQASAGRLVKVRPVDEAPGDDPSAVIARIEAKAKRADIAGALDDLAKLPADVRAPADAWMKKAQARAAALAAAQKIAADAFAALGKPAQ